MTAYCLVYDSRHLPRTGISSITLCSTVEYGLPFFRGVREGSVISPDILNVFMNNFIIQLRLLNVGCHVGSMF